MAHDPTPVEGKFFGDQRRIGVVGLGHMGPAIAYAMAKGIGGPDPANWQKLVLVDVAESALERCRAYFSSKDGTFLSDTVTITSDYSALAGCRIVIEAVTENRALKVERVLPSIAAAVGPECLIMSNSSGFQQDALLPGVGTDQAARFGILHFFNPPDMNRVVEVTATNLNPADRGQLTSLLLGSGFYPIEVKPREGHYGQALNPVFIAVAYEAMLQVQDGLGTPEQVEVVCKKVLGSPIFSVSNMIGGVPIMFEALPELHKCLPWFSVPEILEQYRNAKIPTPKRGEKVDVPAEQAAIMGARFQAVYLGAILWIDSLGIIQREELCRGVQAAFRMKAPAEVFAAVQTPANLCELLDRYSSVHSGFVTSGIVTSVSQAALTPPVTEMKVVKGVAMISLRRPEAFNAVSPAVLDGLEAHLKEVAESPEIIGAVITGPGLIFSAGADLKAMGGAFMGGVDAVRDLIQRGKNVFSMIESSSKPIVIGVTGDALGGGCEITTFGHYVVGSPNARFQLPERSVDVSGLAPKGICPGWGGMVRVPRLAGQEHLAAAIQMIREGQHGFVEGMQAIEMGLLSEIADGEVLIRTCVKRVEDLAAGRIQPRQLCTDVLEFPSNLPALTNPKVSAEGDALALDVLWDVCAEDVQVGYARETDLFLRLCGLVS